MTTYRRFWLVFVLCGISIFFNEGRSVGQSNPANKTNSAQPSAEAASPASSTMDQVPDGQHDFDFLFGSWTVHSRRLLHPLTGSNEWVEFDGTAIDKRIWDGRAQIEEFETESPTGHIEGMTVRIYDAKSRQWSIYWANHSDGRFSLPATVGQFENGRGEFYDQEDYKGKNIFVRYTWTSSLDSPRWEQAFSTDGGRTWETNWVWTLSRMKDNTTKAR